MENARNARNFLDAKKDKVDMPENFAYLSLLQKENPKDFEPLEVPALWSRGVLLEQHVDVVMHLVFLGVIKTFVQHVQIWAKRKGKNEGFLRQMSGVLDSVQGLGLSWCKALPYSKGKLGGWVSENYLALARLLKWFYSGLELLGDDPAFVEPDTPQHQWTMPVNKGWLKVRGLPQKGRAHELRERVKQHMNQEGGPPPIIPHSGGPVQTVKTCVQALSSLVACVMVAEVTPEVIELTDRHVKLFLSAFEAFDANIRPPKKINAPKKGPSDDISSDLPSDDVPDLTESDVVEISEMMGENADSRMDLTPDKGSAAGKKKSKVAHTPKWLSSGNFLCLLNLPRIMKQFGPLRNLWEGKIHGEQILRSVKPEVATVFLSRWHTCLLERIQKKQGMEVVIRHMQEVEGSNFAAGIPELFEENEAEDDVSCLDLDLDEERIDSGSAKNHHRYPSKFSVIEKFHKREPLSFLMFADGKMGCALKDNKFVQFSCVEHIEDINGASYHSWEMTEDVQDDTGESDLPQEPAVHCLLLLPRLCPDGLPPRNSDAVYTTINSQWQEMKANMEFGPSIFTHMD